MRRNKDFVAQVLKYQHGVDGGLDLKVLSRASVEEDHLSLRTGVGKRSVLLEPAFEGATIGARHGGIAVNANDLFHSNANRLNIQRPVGDGSEGRHDATDQACASNELVAKRDSLLLLHVGSRMVDHFGDLHALRTHQRACSTRGAVVDRVINELAFLTVAFCLWTGVLRASEKIGHAHDGALRFTDRALHAGVEGSTKTKVITFEPQNIGFFDAGYNFQTH